MKFTVILFFILPFLLVCNSTNSEQVQILEVETFEATRYLTTIYLEGEVFSRGNEDLIDRGFCLSTTEQNLKENCISEGGINLGEINYTVRALEPNTTYFYSAFAENPNGIGYGRILSISTGNKVNWRFVYEYDDGFNNAELNSLSFINNSQGWIVGNRGIIIKTTDGGKTWDKSFYDRINTREDLLFVNFININQGLVIGSEGTIFRTLDGGNSWSSSNLNVDVFTKSGIKISKTNNNLIAINIGNKILISRDNGAEWQLENIPSNFSASYIELYDEFNLYLSNSQNLYYSSDLGKTWIEKSPKESVSNISRCGMFYQISVSNLFCVEISAGGYVYKSVNSGQSWERINRNNFYPINPKQPYFYDDSNGWFFESSEDEPSPLRTNDSGNTWTKEAVSERVNLTAINFLDEENVWSVGRNYIFKYN